MATPTRNSTTVTHSLQVSYNNEIDSLLGGVKWGGGLGTGVTLSYSFPEGTASFTQSYGGGGDAAEWNAGWHPLNATQQQAFKTALSTISNTANITFVEFNDNATTVGEIRIAMSQEVDTEGSGGWAYFPTPHPSAGDIWLSPDAFLSNSMIVGSWEFNTLIHELGHAVGLSHPFEGNSSNGSSLPQGVNGSDNIFYTVMSYTNDPSGNEFFIDRYPETPMLLDIQVLQYLYGKNTSYNSDNTTYRFTDNDKYFETIWDGGGQDLIDYTSSTTGATINLREGEWSSLGQPIAFTNSSGFEQYTDPRTVWIAYGAEIEDANGSQSDDVIYGNDLNNELYGNLGTDSIFGFDGDDKLIFSPDKTASGAVHAGSPSAEGTGDSISFSDTWRSLDTYNGGEGTDTLLSGSNNDAIFLDNGSGSPLLVSIETIMTQGGDDIVDLTSNSFTYGDVSVYGGDGNDVIWSNDGNDHLNGGGGNDSLDGGRGIDVTSYTETKDSYLISISGLNSTVTGNDDESDSLKNIERITFSDTNLAIDLNASAGIAAKVLGSVFGADSLSNREYVGIALNLLDEGMVYEALMEYALTAAGATTNESVVDLLYTNLVGNAPTASEAATYVSSLESGMSMGDLGVFAADHDLNTTNIDLVGLTQTGIEFI